MTRAPRYTMREALAEAEEGWKNCADLLDYVENRLRGEFPAEAHNVDVGLLNGKDEDEEYDKKDWYEMMIQEIKHTMHERSKP